VDDTVIEAEAVHAGTAEPLRLSPPEAVAYLFELGDPHMKRLIVSGLVVIAASGYAMSSAGISQATSIQATIGVVEATGRTESVQNQMLHVAQSTSSCAGPGDQRWPVGARVCFDFSPYVQVCTPSGSWQQTNERCAGR
jgi:hypothetical protein